jgi:hypothetical protein
MSVGASFLGKAPGRAVDAAVTLVAERLHPAGINATAGTSIAAIPWEHLLGFAGLWLAIYGGGHTIKPVLGGR